MEEGGEEGGGRREEEELYLQLETRERVQTTVTRRSPNAVARHRLKPQGEEGEEGGQVALHYRSISGVCGGDTTGTVCNSYRV